MRWWENVGMEEPSDDTPSVSHSLDSSLREGAGMRAVPFNVPPGNRKIAGDFHRPYERRVPFIVPPGKREIAGDFHRPYETQNI